MDNVGGRKLRACAFAAASPYSNKDFVSSVDVISSYTFKPVEVKISASEKAVVLTSGDAISTPIVVSLDFRIPGTEIEVSSDVSFDEEPFTFTTAGKVKDGLRVKYDIAKKEIAIDTSTKDGVSLIGVYPIQIVTSSDTRIDEPGKTGGKKIKPAADDLSNGYVLAQIDVAVLPSADKTATPRG